MKILSERPNRFNWLNPIFKTGLGFACSAAVRITAHYIDTRNRTLLWDFVLHSGVIVVLQSSAESSGIVSLTWGVSTELSSCRLLSLAKPASLKSVQMHQCKPHSHAALQWVVIRLLRLWGTSVFPAFL